MTTTIAQLLNQGVEPVKSAGSEPPYSASFLKMVQDGERIRVMPTRIGKRKLARFWTVWLEDLILKRTRPEQQFHVSIDNHHVVIGADGVITREGFRETVRQLVAQVHAMEYSPLIPTTNNHKQGGMARTFAWYIDCFPEELNIVRLQELLPKNSRLSFQFYDELKLTYSGSLPTPQHVKLQVEYFACLVYEPADKTDEPKEEEE